MSRLPIPDAPSIDHEAIGALALTITDHARTRYALHRQTRHRLLTDLGKHGARLNQKLTAWWNLDFPGLRREIKVAFKNDIPLKQREEWETWLADHRAQHERLTAEIIRQETALNARVYELFDLNRAEIKIIEDATKYQYAECSRLAMWLGGLHDCVAPGYHGSAHRSRSAFAVHRDKIGPYAMG